MGKRMGRPKKDPFDLVPEEFRSAIEGAKDEEEINKRIAEIAKNDQALAEAKKADPHLTELRGQVREASKTYTDAAKANRQKIKYARQVLEGRGKPAGESGVDEKA